MPATDRAAPDFLKIVAIAALTVAGGHLLWVVSDYSQCFQDNEVFANWAGSVLAHGTSFSWGDLTTALDSWGMDGDSRPRFLSYLIAIWTMKLRLALWSFLPPHPSFSPVWFFSLLVAPWLLYRFLREELACRWSAMIGVGLYMLTAGYLSSASLLFHPGKPLTNVAVIWTFSVALQAERNATTAILADATPLFSRRMLCFLVAFMPLLLFLDETALFCLAIIPVWNYRYFIPRQFSWPQIRPCILNAVLFSLPATIFLFLTFGVFPRLIHALSGRTFDFGSYISRYQDAGKFDLQHLLQHLTTLCAAALSPWSAIKTAMPIAEGPAYNGMLLLWILAPLAYLSWQVFKCNIYRRTYTKTVILMVVYLIFQTLVAAHHPLPLTVSAYYYGATFSVLLAIVLSCGLGSMFRDPKAAKVAAVAAAYLLLVQIYNFSLLNNSWIAHNNAKLEGWFAQLIYNPYVAYADTSEIAKLYATAAPGLYADDIPERFRRHPFASAVDLWRNRDGRYRDYLPTRPLSLGDLWLLSEFYSWQTPAVVAPEQTSSSDFASFIDGYRIAVLRSHPGQPQGEMLPALAFRQTPGSEFDVHGFQNKLAYPWALPGLEAGMQWLRMVGYTHILAPASEGTLGEGPFWNFNNELLLAMRAQSLSRYGLRALEPVRVSGRDIAVLEILR